MDTELDELVGTFEADVVAAVLLCQRAIPSMLATGAGTIVNMSSSSVFLDPPGTVHDNGWSFAYVSAKAGIDQLAGILNVELGTRGIRAFNVEPGFVAYGDTLDELLAQVPRKCRSRRPKRSGPRSPGSSGNLPPPPAEQAGLPSRAHVQARVA